MDFLIEWWQRLGDKQTLLWFWATVCLLLCYWNFRLGIFSAPRRRTVGGLKFRLLNTFEGLLFGVLMMALLAKASGATIVLDFLK